MVTGNPNAKKDFERAERNLRKKGHHTINPYTIIQKKGLTDRPAIMMVLFLVLMQCGGIYMLSGWEYSPGARVEHAVAAEIGLQISYEEATTNV